MSLQGGCLRCLHRTIYRPSPEKPEAKKKYVQFSSVHSVVSNSLRPHNCRMPGFPVHHQHAEFTQIHVHESVMPSNHLILCHTLLLPPSIFPSIRVFSNQSILSIRWPKYWSFSFTPVLKMNIQNWFPLGWTGWTSLLSKGLKSFLQHHSSKASFFWHSAFFIVQLSHPYMTTGKTITLTRWTFVSKVMSLLFNMLSQLVTTFLPRHKHLLISWLQSVILEPKKIVCHYFHCFPIYFPWSDGTRCHDLSFLNVEF